MTNDFASFGDPGRFEIAMRWRGDAEPHARRPTGYGWSIGDIRITVADINLTRTTRGATIQTFASWYLLPIASWMASNWGRLLHEEEFAWAERSAAPAAMVVMQRLHSLIAARDEQGRQDYKLAQDWRSAHALCSASSGGLFPDLYLRRYLDTIELSWSSGSPLFAPDQFRFTSEPGVAYLPVTDVATPLWDAVTWLVETGANQPMNDRDREELQKLSDELKAISNRTVVDFAAYRIGRKLAEVATDALKARGIVDLLVAAHVDGVPAVARFSPAIAMYGGLAPNLTEGDVATLSDVIADAYRRSAESPLLSDLIDSRSGPPIRPPYLEGHDLAIALLEETNISGHVEDFVDVAALLDTLGVGVLHRELETETIRGVSLAGEKLAPTIVVNRSSVYNESEHGIRFTLAHELAHLLYDRSMARSVGISSGPWAPAGIEKRANAFAAMFLMPRRLVLGAFDDSADFGDLDAIAVAADRLRVSTSALIEHLANLSLIGEYQRDRLRGDHQSRSAGRVRH